MREVWALISKRFPTCHIAWAFRNEETQNEFYREGKTRERWPNSQHNSLKEGAPWARALDLFQIDEDNVALFPPKLYWEISEFLKASQLPVTWSGTWTQKKNHFTETDHFQLDSDIL